MSQSQQLQQLKKQLWNIANDLRGKMGADEFRDYILGFIFYKYLSDKFIRFANNILAEEGEGFDNFANFDTSNPEHLIENVKIIENELPISNSTILDLHRRFDNEGKNWKQLT